MQVTNSVDADKAVFVFVRLVGSGPFTVQRPEAEYWGAALARLRGMGR